MKMCIEEIEFVEDEIIQWTSNQGEVIDITVLYRESEFFLQKYIQIPRFTYNKHGQARPYHRINITDIKDNIAFLDYCPELFENITSTYSHYSSNEKIDNLNTVVVKYKNTIGIVSDINASFRKLTSLEKEDFKKDMIGGNS